MTLPLSACGFLPVGQILIEQTLAHLRLAQRYPLHVSCAGEARYADPDLDRWSFERDVDLGTCSSLSEAIYVASRRIARDNITLSLDEALRFAPHLIAILDVEHGLVLAGEALSGRIVWCAPVASDAEARAVVTKASRLRAEAQRHADLGAHGKAGKLRRKAASLEGRLVDPFWRDAAQLALLQARAA